MNEEEKLNMVPKLKEQGNQKFKEKNYQAASDSYAQAIGILEQLMMQYVYLTVVNLGVIEKFNIFFA